jgi:endogenous inhibitor of DNA gyrase (YacG/DUF329 family)
MTKKGMCALCSNPVDPAFRPFCSRGCRDRDLLGWLGETYRVPVRPDEEAQDVTGDAPDGDSRY